MYQHTDDWAGRPTESSRSTRRDATYPQIPTPKTDQTNPTTHPHPRPPSTTNAKRAAQQRTCQSSFRTLRTSPSQPVAGGAAPCPAMVRRATCVGGCWVFTCVCVCVVCQADPFIHQSRDGLLPACVCTSRPPWRWWGGAASSSHTRPKQQKRLTCTARRPATTAEGRSAPVVRVRSWRAANIFLCLVFRGFGVGLGLGK